MGVRKLFTVGDLKHCLKGVDKNLPILVQDEDRDMEAEALVAIELVEPEEGAPFIRLEHRELDMVEAIRFGGPYEPYEDEPDEEVNVRGTYTWPVD